MASDIKQHRAEEVIRSIAAEFIARTSNKSSLITVTGIDLSPDGKRVKVFLSVLPDHAMHAVLDFANRQQSEFRQALKDRSRLRVIPAVSFEKDIGEINRRRVTELLAEDNN